MKGAPKVFQLATTYEIRKGKVAVMAIHFNVITRVFRERMKLIISEPIVSYKISEPTMITPYLISVLSIVGTIAPSTVRVVNDSKTLDAVESFASFFANSVPLKIK